MELKKNPDVEVGRNSSLYFAVGLIVMLLITNILLQHKTYDTKGINLDTLVMDENYEEEIPITNINTPPPPPPPITISENVVIVEDLEDIKESIIESTESSQEDVIDARIVSIEEVKVEKVEEDVEIPFAIIESAPIFPGCEGGSKQEIRDCFQAKMIEHIQKNFKYPETAQELGIHGKVYVGFVIDKNGIVTKIQSRGPDKLLEQEAERIISLLPKMTPGKQRGRPTKVPYSIPINFKYVEY
jgi:protein TonB